MKKSLIVAGVVAIGLAVLYWQVLAKLVFDWYHDDNYSHGFLIIPIAAYLAWERRTKLIQTEAKPSLFGMVVVIGSIALLLAGILGSELFLTRFSLVTML